jgi:hypothetical protein
MVFNFLNIRAMKYVIMISMCIGFSACFLSNDIAGNHTYKTECISVEADGSQILKAWGNGKNMAEASQQAQKKALNDVLFNGVFAGKPTCETRPLVTEVNARQKYTDYFDRFFSDNGNYKKFISSQSNMIDKVNDRKGAGQRVTQGVVVRVDLPSLRQQLIKDGIRSK